MGCQSSHWANLTAVLDRIYSGALGPTSGTRLARPYAPRFHPAAKDAATTARKKATAAPSTASRLVSPSNKTAAPKTTTNTAIAFHIRFPAAAPCHLLQSAISGLGTRGASIEPVRHPHRQANRLDQLPDPLTDRPARRPHLRHGFRLGGAARMLSSECEASFCQAQRSYFGGTIMTA
jgi:hypothetical protein